MWSGPRPTEKTFPITKFGCTSLSRQRPGRRTRAAEKSTSAIAPKKTELRHTATAKKRGISDRSLVLSVIHMTTVFMDEFRKFIKVDNHAAVEIGDSATRRRTRLRSVLSGPSSTKTFQKQQGVDELTLRRGEEVGCAPSSIPAVCESCQSGGRKMRTTTCGRGLARSLPNHLQGRRGNGRGCSSSSWKETGQSTFATRVGITGPKHCGK